MRTNPLHELRGRELETMQLLQERGEVSVEEVRTELRGPRLSPSAVRTVLARLVEKGHASVNSRDGRNLYRPRRASAAARQTAVERVVTTFFDGSSISAALTLLDRASSDEIQDLAVRERLERLIQALRDQDSAGS